ncbi:hypothetical protein ACFSKM_18850 [Ancylobacter dichloromethanicus]
MARLRSTVFLLLLVVWTALLAVTIPYYALRNAPPATRRFSRLWAGG